MSHLTNTTAVAGMAGNVIPPVRRTRGGQKGNRNACKHGFYSTKLSPDEVCRFWNIAALEGVDPEMAVFRLKLQSLLRQDPGNRRVLLEATKALAKWSSARYGLDRDATRILGKLLRGVLERHARSKSTVFTKRIGPVLTTLPGGERLSPGL